MPSKKRAIQRYRKIAGGNLISGKGNRSYPVTPTGHKARATPKRRKHR